LRDNPLGRRFTEKDQHRRILPGLPTSPLPQSAVQSRYESSAHPLSALLDRDGAATQPAVRAGFPPFAASLPDGVRLERRRRAGSAARHGAAVRDVERALRLRAGSSDSQAHIADRSHTDAGHRCLGRGHSAAGRQHFRRGHAQLADALYSVRRGRAAPAAAGLRAERQSPAQRALRQEAVQEQEERHANPDAPQGAPGAPGDQDGGQTGQQARVAQRELQAAIYQQQVGQDDGGQHRQRHIAQGAPHQLGRLPALEQQHERQARQIGQQTQGDHHQPDGVHRRSLHNPTRMPTRAAASRPSL